MYRWFISFCRICSQSSELILVMRWAGSCRTLPPWTSQWHYLDLRNSDGWMHGVIDYNNSWWCPWCPVASKTSNLSCSAFNFCWFQDGFRFTAVPKKRSMLHWTAMHVGSIWPVYCWFSPLKIFQWDISFLLLVNYKEQIQRPLWSFELLTLWLPS